jgi:hypothetical protein
MLFALAIFLGTRHAGDAGPPVAAPPPAPVEKVVAERTGPATAVRTPRRMEPANRHELETTLPQGAPVDVTANDGDPEAFRLAGEIRAFLLGKGYRVGDVTRSISTPPAKGVGLEPLADGKWRVIVGGAEE